MLCFVLYFTLVAIAGRGHCNQSTNVAIFMKSRAIRPFKNRQQPKNLAGQDKTYPAILLLLFVSTPHSALCFQAYL